MEINFPKYSHNVNFNRTSASHITSNSAERPDNFVSIYSSDSKIADLNNLDTKQVVPFEASNYTQKDVLRVVTNNEKKGRISQTLIDSEGKIVARISRKTDCSERIMAMTGASGLALFVATKDNLLYKMCEGSKFKTDDVTVELPEVHYYDPTFEGNLHVSLSKDQGSEDVKQSINNFWTSGNINYFTNNKSAYNPKQDYELFIPAGGKGSRSNSHKIKFDTDLNYSISTPKPSIDLPLKSYDGQNNVSFIEMSLSPFVSPNVLNNNSETHFIEEETARGNAHSFVTSLVDGSLPDNKPVFVAYSDSVADIDFQKFLNSYENKPEAAIMLTAVKVHRGAVPHVGLFKLESNDKDDMYQIRDLAEKTTDEEVIEKFKLSDGSFYSNRSFYIFSPEALKALKVLAPDIENVKNVDFMHEICKVILDITEGRETEFPVDENRYKEAQKILKGKGLYVDLLEGRRADIGNLRKFIINANRLGQGYFNYSPQIIDSFKRNTDEKGCVYMPDVKPLSQKYLQEHNGSISGNILVEQLLPSAK